MNPFGLSKLYPFADGANLVAVAKPRRLYLTNCRLSHFISLRLWIGSLCGLLAANSTTALAETAAGLARQGEEYYKAEKFDEAIASYKQALAMEPNSALLHY